MVPDYMARYPGVSLDLVVDGRLVDIVAEGFDAGIRLAEDVPADMVAVRFGEDVRFLAVASPSYLTGTLLRQARTIWPAISAFASVYPAVNATAGSFPATVKASCWMCRER
jgi:DNA-binding transcriptional LysR family regulator